MKPLMLQGHERPITQLKYNREGDLLFTCSKDVTPNVWYSLNGERLGTYKGHAGAVWCMDVDWETTTMVTGAADNTLKLWDVSNGEEIDSLDVTSTVRSCGYNFAGDLIAFSTDTQRKQKCELNVIDRRVGLSGKDFVFHNLAVSKITATLWGPGDKKMITGHDNGQISQWDLRTGTIVNETVGHQNATINDLQLSKDGMMFISASSDHTAKLFDSEALTHLKTYQTERPVNSAAISPILDHVILGGGQEASIVTTTSTRIGKFDSRFFHLVFEEEFARVKGHFGPINSLAFHPDGKSYATGGEDGYARLQTFDQSYFDFNFDF